MKYKLLLLTVFFINAAAFAQLPKEAYPFENEIKAYKYQDSLQMPPAGGMLFIGSSSIRKWTGLPKRFPDKPVIMRGVGGSTVAQWVKYYMPQVVYPYRPAKIFVYVGDNDIAAGSGAQAVCDNFVKMQGMIRHNLPDAAVYYMGMKLSPSRARYYNEVKLGNKLILAYIKTQQNVYYIDVNTTLLTPKALPDSSFFQADMLHLNQSGYERWEKVITPYLN